MSCERRVPEWIRSNANTVIAAFTVVIALTTVVQLCIYQAQLSEMRIDQRAWLAVKLTPFSGPIVGATLPAPIFIENIGKTVAKNIKGFIFFRPVALGTTIDVSEYARVSPSSLPQGEPIPAWTFFSTGVLYPNDPFQISQPAFARTPSGENTPKAAVWDQGLEDQWTRGDIYLALNGKFTYDDAAGNPHWTTFCSTFVDPSSAKNVSLDTSMRCVAYNTVDSNK